MHHISVIHLASDAEQTSLKFYDREKKKADVCLFTLSQQLKFIKC